MYVVMLIVILEGLMNKVMRMHHIVELVADELWPSFSKAFEYNNKHYHIHVVIPVNNLPDLDSSPEPEKRESKAIEHYVTLKRFELSKLCEMEIEEARTWLVELF